MFDHWLRMLKDRWLAPVALALGSRVPPNAVTVLAFVAGVLCAAAAARGWRGTSAGLWLANRVLDGLDGTLARVHHRQSAFGGYLDIVLDFVVYAAVPIGMLLAPGMEGLLWPGVLLMAAFFVNAASWMYLSAILEGQASGARERGELTTITMPPGLVAGAETFAFYLAFLLVPNWRAAGFLLMAGLVMVNVVQRLVWAWHRLR